MLHLFSFRDLVLRMHAGSEKWCSIYVQDAGLDSAMRTKKRQRMQLARLVADLDSLIPSNLRRQAQKNGAGRRAVGAGGRSLHDVLLDAVHAVQCIRPGG